MGSSRIIQATTAALALGLLGIGLWAMIAPDGFYEAAATYPPYNRHFIHDIGAFVIGLGAGVLALVVALLTLARWRRCGEPRRI